MHVWQLFGINRFLTAVKCRPHVAVALSGGVDSAVSLLALRAFSVPELRQRHFHFSSKDMSWKWNADECALGSTCWTLDAHHQSTDFDITAVHMRNWAPDAEDGGQGAHATCSEKYLRDAAAICQNLGIDLKLVDFSAQYWEHCFQPLISSFERRAVINPDILCNSQIKFKCMLEHVVQEYGCSHLATGHYSRLVSNDNMMDAGEAFPATPRSVTSQKDPLNDQTYFLSAVHPAALYRAVFPLGEFFESKQQVRRFASAAKSILHDVAGKPTSTGICFIGPRPFASFMSQYTLGLEAKTMVIQDADGTVVSPASTSLDVAALTIGQKVMVRREGSKAIEKSFVYKKGNNCVFVCDRWNHPLMYRESCLVHIAEEDMWKRILRLSGAGGVLVACRHQEAPAPCSLSQAEGTQCLTVVFDRPHRAVTPGQSAVFYTEARGLDEGGAAGGSSPCLVCLGCGCIQS